MADTFAWQTGAPQDHGLAPARLDALRNGLAARRTRAFLLVRHDRIVCEWYAPDFPPTRRHYTASLAKSLVGGLALNLALQDHLIGLGDFACDYIHPWQTHAARCRIRVLHLATHCSGLDDSTEGTTPHGLLPGWKGAFWKRESPDPFTVARDLAPIVAEPGTHVPLQQPRQRDARLCDHRRPAGHACRRTSARCCASGSSARSASTTPTGRSATARRITVDGLPLVPNWAGASFTARATARLGRLLLRQGDWQGRRSSTATGSVSAPPTPAPPCPTAPPPVPGPRRRLAGGATSTASCATSPTTPSAAPAAATRSCWSSPRWT